jgi:molecular chaperone DnaK
MSDKATTTGAWVGIDLGTTNSACAVFDGERVQLVRNAQGGGLTPSVVRIDARGNVTVGARARRFLDGDPANTRAEFKRLMGTAQAIEYPAAKVTKRPEELAAEILKSLREDVREQLGFLPERAVISVPALFELPQSAATSEAARLAGFERVELIQEPVASAIAAGWSAEESRGYWLVYDLGGGTFDASLLETQEGLLRVVGHDGDNFLGGRDFDWAIVDWAIAELGKSGARIDRANPSQAKAVRALKHAAEEAKIELARAGEASIVLPGLDVDGEVVDVDLTLTRATLEALCLPLVERSIAVCQRLLSAHGVGGSALERVVLVGGPTVMPLVRREVAARLEAPLGEGLDPMTLVAEGAAIYAATAGLDARPRAATATATAARRLWMQYPAMSSDLTPHVVGRLLPGGGGGGGPEPVTLRLTRADGLWASEPAALDNNSEGGFVIMVELIARKPNVFRVEAAALDGTPVAVEPATITIVQGLTVSDPPLSRTIGVALANDQVRVYFERGAPLPARRTFVHHTVESVAKGSAECALKIPIVQGELPEAHLCRLVGSLTVRGDLVRESLPAGAPIELTIELDRGGRLSARALIPSTGQVFEEVATLLVPEATPEVLAASREALAQRLSSLRSDAFRRGDRAAVDRLGGLERQLAEAARDAEAAKGGDADAAQKARRALLEIDALLEEVERDKSWPELEQRARERMAAAASWVAEYGSPEEQRILSETAQAIERARAVKDAVEIERQLRVVMNLANACYYRDPEAWARSFEHAAADAASATDQVRAHELVKRGRAAIERNDRRELREVVEALWRLLPVDPAARRRGHDSGVR